MDRKLEKRLGSIAELVAERERRNLVRQAEANPDMTFMSSEFLQCTLPHLDPGKVRIWKRTNNLITLKIESGSDSRTDELLGIPYGIIPRLLIFFINREAVRNQNDPEFMYGRKIVFGRNLSRFMHKIGLDGDSHGKRSDYKRMIVQATRLFSARVTIVDETMPERELPPRADMLVTDNQDLWWDTRTAEQDSIFESHIMLSERFTKAIISRPVPLDLNAIKMLKRSPMALDLYGWSGYRIHAVNRAGKPLTIPLAALQPQFGADYTLKVKNEQGEVVTAPNRKDFNRYFKIAMGKVKTAYPALNYEIKDATITFYPSATPIISKED
jgi:hypothetical protein